MTTHHEDCPGTVVYWSLLGTAIVMIATRSVVAAGFALLATLSIGMVVRGCLELAAIFNSAGRSDEEARRP